MTGFKSKRDMAEDKLFGDALTIAYQSGFYDGKKAAQPAQEPDTYRSVPHGHCTHPRCKEVFSAYIEANKRLAHYEPEGKSPMILNAAPPQRTWVELTNKEIEECNQFTSNNTTCIYLYKDDFEENGINFARAVLAKSKEKNT